MVQRKTQITRKAICSERGAALVEWLFVVMLLVVILTGFFTIALPKVQAYAAKTAVETAMLDRISIAPPQLGVISGAGSAVDGLTPLNLLDPAAFDQRVDSFFSNLKTTVDPEISTYGFKPASFEYCLAISYQGSFESELVEGTPVTLTRSSRGLGMRCSDAFRDALVSGAGTQWASLTGSSRWSDLALIQSAFASSVSQQFIAIVGALDSEEKVCPLGACIVAGPVAGQEEPLTPPDVTPTPDKTPTQPPTATPDESPTAAPTATEIPTETAIPTESPMPTETPIPTQTAIPTETPADSPTPQFTPTEIPTVSPTSTPVDTATAVATPTPNNTPTAIPTETPDPLPSMTPEILATESPTPSWTNTPLITVLPPTRTPLPAPTETSLPVLTRTPSPSPTTVSVATPPPKKTLVIDNPDENQ